VLWVNGTAQRLRLLVLYHEGWAQSQDGLAQTLGYAGEPFPGDDDQHEHEHEHEHHFT
jgi:hypothetical protein